VKPLLAACAVLMALPVANAQADGIADVGQELLLRRFASARQKTEVDLAGYLRMRGVALHNLDLDHGLTPSGMPLFPVPLFDPNGQTLHAADTRLRTDFTIYPRGAGVAVNVRVDVLDNLGLGSTPEGKPATGRAPNPAASPGQTPPTNAMRIKRAYGEVLTPFGVLATGRMGAHWGLGMLSNSGDCDDCNFGDVADRIAFVSPMAGHIWAASYDMTASGPVATRKDQARVIDVEPTDDVHTVTFAVLNVRTAASVKRRRRAGLTTVEYGAYISHRWQTNDVPADYLPTASPIPLDSNQVMARGYSATATDAWLRLTTGNLRVEAELAYLGAKVEQASLIPGVSLDRPVTSDQLGLAFQSDYGKPSDALGLGLDFGFASGDSAPGFGAFPQPNSAAPMAGDLDGPQASLPRDSTVDNFRFHPDYQIDRILFREIIGTVTDAIYVRPHGRYHLVDMGHGRLTASMAVIASWAVKVSSTPGGQRFMGIEIDPSLTYETRDGFRVALEHAIFFPGNAFNRRSDNRAVRTAQLVRLRLGYFF